MDRPEDMASAERRCFCGEDLEALGYDGWAADDDLEAWRAYGPRETTQELIDVLVGEGIEGARVLDIGAGVGMVHVALLQAGAARAVDVDASRQYLDAAREEAERLGLGERVEYRYGDVVALATGAVGGGEGDGLAPADVVTADSVICCYPFLAEFVAAAASVRPRLIGLTYPSDAWWSRLEMRALNLWWRIVRKPDRWFVHRRRELDGLMASAGFEEAYWGGSRWWRVVVYRALP